MTLHAHHLGTEGPVEHDRPGSRRTPGVLVVVVLACVATVIGLAVPIAGAPVTGIVLGVLISPLVRRTASLRPGIAFASTSVLQIAVVLLGFQLSLPEIAHAGLSSLPTMVGTLVVCLTAAYYIGRWLGIDADLRTLIGVGTGVCGASAIAAVTPVIRPRSTHISYAISTIFCFNIAAVLVFPPLGHLLHLSQDAFGLFAGTAVNDTSSVVAAAATYGPEAADKAVVVKLTRTLMIIPICLGLSYLLARRARTSAPADGAAKQPGIARLVPWFLVAFLVAAAVNSVGLVPDAAHLPVQKGALFMITMALSAIGLTTDLSALRRAGVRPLLLGGILWIIVSTSSLVLQFATR